MKDSFYAFIAVGSNIEPLKNIPAALELLKPHTTVIASSTFYETTPLGPAGDAPFMNGVWLISTPLPVSQIKDTLLRPIESQLGRVRTSEKYAPRPVDLDLVFYHDHIIDTNDIQRPFVHMPMRELLTHLPNPTLQNTIARLLPPATQHALGTIVKQLTATLNKLL